MIAGIIGAKDNGIGVVDVAPGAKIYSIKIDSYILGESFVGGEGASAVGGVAEVEVRGPSGKGDGDGGNLGGDGKGKPKGDGQRDPAGSTQRAPGRPERQRRGHRGRPTSTGERTDRRGSRGGPRSRPGPSFGWRAWTRAKSPRSLLLPAGQRVGWTATAPGRRPRRLPWPKAGTIRFGEGLSSSRIADWICHGDRFPETLRPTPPSPLDPFLATFLRWIEERPGGCAPAGQGPTVGIALGWQPAFGEAIFVSARVRGLIEAGPPPGRRDEKPLATDRAGTLLADRSGSGVRAPHFGTIVEDVPVG